MKIAAIVLGFLGAVAGFFGAFIVYNAGQAGAVNTIPGIARIPSAYFALLLALVALVGAGITETRLKLGGYLILIVGVGGLIAQVSAYAVAGPLLIIGGILALIDGYRQRPTAQPAGAGGNKQLQQGRRKTG
ncbi:MAG: hypothetical protein ACYC56_05605 [Candidatus Aquicultor sp.]